MMLFISLIIAVVIGIVLYFLSPLLNVIYLCIRYGSGLVDIYLNTNSKKLNICGYIARRGDLIKFFIPHKDIYVEGSVIGMSKDNIVYVKEFSGVITWYNASLITDNDLIYLK